ncbi:MAG TPA: hypothetical protein VJB99_01320, partial [Patescibacteria group bacterium]|nr:hypothetical protein [Patescibacteria group bacterium]
MDLTTERIAEVALVQRLPRHCDGFSYGVPSGMDVRRGTAVRVPFRFASSVPGFVRSVRPGDPHRRGFKWINEIVPDNALSEEEMDRIEETAFETVQSVSAVLYAAFPFFEKNQKGKSSKKEPDAPLEHLPLKIRSSEAAIISSLVTKINRLPCGFFQGRDFSQSAAAVAGYLYAHPDERVVVLVPTVRDG